MLTHRHCQLRARVQQIQRPIAQAIRARRRRSAWRDLHCCQQFLCATQGGHVAISQVVGWALSHRAHEVMPSAISTCSQSAWAKSLPTLPAEVTPRLCRRLLELDAIIPAPAFSQLGQRPISVLVPLIQQQDALQPLLESGKSAFALYQGQQLIPLLFYWQ